MSDLTDRLDEIQARAEAATPGPWRAGTEEGVDYGSVMGAPKSIGGGYVTVPVLVDDLSMYEGTAEFIAASRTDVPRLVAALRAVLDLHRDAGQPAFCTHCQALNDGQWPCPTVQAIADALGIGGEEKNDDR